MRIYQRLRCQFTRKILEGSERTISCDTERNTFTNTASFSAVNSSPRLFLFHYFLIFFKSAFEHLKPQTFSCNLYFDFCSFKMSASLTSRLLSTHIVFLTAHPQCNTGCCCSFVHLLSNQLRHDDCSDLHSSNCCCFSHKHLVNYVM